MRSAIATVVLVAVWLSAGQAGATPTSKLVYSRSVDAGSCPDEQALRRAVAARVGYDPFFAYATRTIVASLTRRNQAFVATVDLVDEGGVSHGARELRAEGDCSELLDAVALAIAIAIDPQSLTRPTTPAPAPDPPPAPSPPPAVVVAAPQPTADAPATPAPAPPSSETATPWSFDVSAGLAGSVGFAPGPSAGLALGADARWRWLSLGLEGRVDAPASTSATSGGGGTVSSWLLLGAVVPCAHLGSFFGCALVQAGSAQTSGSGVADPRSQSLPWLAAGGRLGMLVGFTDDLRLRIHADVVANLDPMTLQLYGGTVWQAPPAAASLSADLVLHFR